MRQNNYLKINFNDLDRELTYCDAYGMAIIFCNFATCQRILSDTDQQGLYLYKGHQIYIDPDMNDLEYRIFPIINIDKLLKKFSSIYEYKKEACYNNE